MHPSDDRDIERLREIARRVGELAHGRPEVVDRLQQSWTDYVAIHTGFVKERERRELAQRKFAIEILKQGFLEEQPRKEHEPSWDWEVFRVRVPVKLRFEANAAKTPTARAKVDKKVAKAILKYIEDEDQIVGCADPVKRAELFNRRQAATPNGEYEQRTFTVGFRPRPEFKMGPHPLFCSWREFQELPTETRATVALATLATLHDELSATPVLKPIPRTFSEGDADAREIVVQWAVRECLSATTERPRSSAPPRPDPGRLSVERAEAFLVMLETTVRGLEVKDDMKPEAHDRRNQAPRGSATLVGSASAFGFLEENPPNLVTKEWEASLRNWLRSIGNTTREQLGVISLPQSRFKRSTLHDELPSVHDATIWLGLIASVFIDGVVPASTVTDASPDVLACFAFCLHDLRREKPAPMLKLDAQTVVVTFEGVGTYTMSVETLVIYSRRALRAIAFLTPEARKGLVEQFSPTEPGPTMADLATAVGISDDTFARVRKAAGVDHGLRGTKARGYRYSPEMVAKLIAAAMAGKYLERKAMAEKWSKWSRANRN